MQLYCKGLDYRRYAGHRQHYVIARTKAAKTQPGISHDQRNLPDVHKSQEGNITPGPGGWRRHHLIGLAETATM